MVSTRPERSKTELEGEGLKTAISGKTSTVNLIFYDTHGNPCNPGASYHIGLSINSFSNKVKKLAEIVEHDDFSGSWDEPTTSGRYTLTYVARTAGPFELHVWCEHPGSNGTKEQLPGSPFNCHILPGEPTAAQSYIDGYTNEARNRENKGAKAKGGGGKDGGGKDGELGASMAGEASREEVVAGDTVMVRVYGVDQYANPTVLSDAALSAKAVGPDGSESVLALKAGRASTAAGGSTYYEVRHDAVLSGRHEVHVRLHGQPVTGSPCILDVSPAAPVPSMSRLIPPEDADSLIADFEEPTTLWLETRDKFNNLCNTGGLRVSGRLQLIKQSTADNTILMPNNHTVAVDDLMNGTYAVRVSIMMRAVVKLVVNMDKDLPGTGGDLPPIQLAFERDGSNSKDAKVQDVAASTAAIPVDGPTATAADDLA